MTDKNMSDNTSLFKQIVQENDSSGELKTQFTIDLTEYDTSTMPGYREGNKVYKGFTCKLATLKPLKAHPRGRIDIDPSNEKIRKAILSMYSAYDKLLASK